MNAKQIQSLVLSLPADAPYFRLMFAQENGTSPKSLAKRLQVALADPELLAHLCQSYASARQPLPEFAWPPVVYRAYHFFLAGDSEDEDLATAQQLQSPHRRFERDVIRGLLMCPNATDESIAEMFQLKPEVVNLFESLWWNVRDRSRELLFFTQLLNGTDALGEAEDAHQAEFARRLMRIARTTGNMREVFLEAGLTSLSGEGLSEKALLERIQRRLLEEAAVSQQKGLTGKQDNPALALLAKHVLFAEDAEPIDPMLIDHLLALSQNKQAQAQFRNFAQRQLRDVLNAQQLLAHKQTRESKPPPEYEI